MLDNEFTYHNLISFVPSSVKIALNKASGEFEHPPEVDGGEAAWYLTGGAVASVWSVGKCRGNILSHSREYESWCEWREDILQ